MRVRAPKLTGPCELCNAKKTTNWRRIPTSVPGFDGQLQTGCNPCYVRLMRQLREDPSLIEEALAVCRSHWKDDPVDMMQQPGASDFMEEEVAAAEPSGEYPGMAASSNCGGHQSAPLLACPPATGAVACCRSPVARSAAGFAGQWTPDSLAMPFAGVSPAMLGADAWQQRLQPGLQPPVFQPPPVPLPQPMSPQSPPPSPTPQLRLQQVVQQGAAPGSPASRSSQTPAQLPAPGTLAFLQESSWRLLSSSEDACFVASEAYERACKLPGRHPHLVAALPSAYLLLPRAREHPAPVGVLLLRVLLPAASLPEDVQRLLLEAGTGLQTTLRIVLFCRQTGQVVLFHDWVQQNESKLFVHPRYNVPAWESSAGWQLVFPQPELEVEAQLFSSTIAVAGDVSSADASPPFTVTAPSGRVVDIPSPFGAPAAPVFPVTAVGPARPQLQPTMLVFLSPAWSPEAATQRAAAVPLSPIAAVGGSQLAAFAPAPTLVPGSPFAQPGTPPLQPSFWPAPGTPMPQPQPQPQPQPTVNSRPLQLPGSPQAGPPATWFGEAASIPRLQERPAGGEVFPPAPPLTAHIEAQRPPSRASATARRTNSLVAMFMPPLDLPIAPSLDLADESVMNWIGSLEGSARGAGDVNHVA